MKILYLDYNGVLHDARVLRNRKRGMYLGTPGKTFFEWMPILEDLLAPYPDVKIVLSTSWVRSLGFNDAIDELGRGLQDRVIGSTFHHPGLLQSAFDTMSRGRQIIGDVERRKPESWFALDDDTSDWPEKYRDRLIATRGDLGLSDPLIQDQVKKMLAAL